MKAAITAAKAGGPAANTPIALLVRRGDRYETVRIAYYQGLRYPWLESTSPGRPNGFDRLLAPTRK
jgi:hypothetical protein